MCQMTMHFLLSTTNTCQNQINKAYLENIYLPLVLRSFAADWQFSVPFFQKAAFLNSHHTRYSTTAPFLSNKPTCCRHMCLITFASCYSNNQMDKLLNHISTSVSLLALCCAQWNSTDMCIVWATGGSEQLVTSSLRQMSMILSTVEAFPPDCLVCEVWHNWVRGPLDKLGTSLAA